jgi:hypothetical protein
MRLQFGYSLANAVRIGQDMWHGWSDVNLVTYLGEQCWRTYSRQLTSIKRQQLLRTKDIVIKHSAKNLTKISLWRLSVTVDGFWIYDRTHCILWYSGWLQFIWQYYTHTLVTTIKSSLQLLGTGFQMRTFHILWVPELSPASATNFSQQQLTMTEPQQSSKQLQYVTTDSQSASLSRCQVQIWGPGPEFCYCQTVVGLLMWGSLSDERMGLSFTTAAGFASAVILRSDSRGIHDNLLLSRFRDCPNLED